MLVTISTTMDPATDLGFLLHKHPEKVQSFPVTAGTAHVFYPEATARRCTAALVLDVDPVALVRGSHSRPTEAFTLGQYVNDRPYAASSMLAVALGRVFKTAMAGRCDAKPDLAAKPLPLELHVPALPCRGGANLAGRLFGPLDWQVTADPVPLDPHFPDWGDSPYVDLRLTGSLRLADALSHLYVLLPVLDDAKHYWVSADEVDKLVRAGHGWLAGHPELDLITRRYLAHKAGMQSAALARLAEADDSPAEAIDNATDEPVITAEPEPQPQSELESKAAARKPHATAGSPAAGEPAQPPSLAELRATAVLTVLRDTGARSVADLGCGDGKLLARLLADPAFTRVIGADVSARALHLSGRRLARMAERQRDRAELLHTSLVYTDERLRRLDAAVLMEVVEHIDPPRLPAMDRAVFGFAAPAMVVVTTPNAEHNVRYAALAPGSFRHADHRFEWTRAQFRGWASGVAAAFGYTVRFLPVGGDDPDVGPPTQMAVFSGEFSRTASPRTPT